METNRYHAEQINLVRTLVQRGVVLGSNDTEGIPRADLLIQRNHQRTGVEMFQQWGVASRPPRGGVALVFSVGGDHGDLVGISAGHPSQRLGGLDEGEVALYQQNGSRVHLKRDGAIEIRSNQRVYVKVGTAAEVEVEKDMIRARLVNGLSRFVVRPHYVKMAFKDDFFSIKEGLIEWSIPAVVGPHPEPHL